MSEQDATLDDFVNSRNSEDGDWTDDKLKNLLAKDEAGAWGNEPNNEGVPVLRATNFAPNQIDLDEVAYREIPESKRESKRLKSGDLVIERSGGSADQPVGRVLFFELDGEYYPGNFLRLVRPDTSQVNARYLYYRLDYDYRRGETVSIQSNTTNIRNLQYGSYLNQDIPLPPFEEQRKIATVLYTVDQAIQKTEEIIDQLFRVRRGTIRELLTTGPPSKPGEKINIGPDQYYYPADWSVAPLSELINITSGEYFPADDFCEDGIRCLKIDNVHYGRIIWENETYLPEDFLDEYADLVLTEGDILLAMNRPITNNKIKVGMMEKDDEPALLYQRVGKLTPNEKIRSEYLVYALSEGPFKHQLERQLVGSDQPYINKSQLKNIKIPVPSLEEQNKIIGHISSIDSNHKLEQESLERFKRIKQGLMQDLLSGTVRTTDTNIEVPEEIAQYG